MRRKSFTLFSHQEQDTINAGSKLGALLFTSDVIALCGELGSGKTYFTKGVAIGLGLADPSIVTSPSFVLLVTYMTRNPLRHYDLYRVDGQEIISLGFFDFKDSSISIIEWADKIDKRILGDHLEVKFAIISGQTRAITFKAYGQRYETLIDQLKRDLS
jgi:tRNA threonylcarbamoyladenosine biosynthesis protein TsaE